MTIVEKHVNPAIFLALTTALREEIELFRNSDRTKLLKEEEFNPTKSYSCFLGQTYYQNDEDRSNWAQSYREEIGFATRDLGKFDGSMMTPLEVWSAYMWSIDKELVLNVLRYVKGTSDVLPEVRYEEAQIVGQIEATEESPE
jgi:hypothetical protein